MALAIQPDPNLICTADEPEEVARAAGLRYAHDDRPGITRRRRGAGFSYTKPDGTTVTGSARERIDALAIPPAWTDVWIATDPLGHIQATGRDAKGRKQYRYHPRWREVRDANKYDRLATFGAALPDVRQRVLADLQRPGLDHDKVVALAVRLLDDTLVRVGNVEYANDNETYGLTTLRADHVSLSGSRVELSFVGKAGVEHEVRIRDARLARLIRRCHELGGQQLFTYEGPDEEPVPITSAEVNEYLRALVGADTSAKDFRTWGGSVMALESLARGPAPDDDTPARDVDAAILAAIDDAAEQLHNTRAVCRSCYVHPAVTDGYRTGALHEVWKVARASRWLARAERATIDLIDAAT